MERTIRIDAADYLSRALAEIDDLTGDTREDLRDSIESAVVEVAAEFPDDLELLLGPPQKFVAELRVAAGVDPAPSQRLLGARTLARARAWADERAGWIQAHDWTKWLAGLARELRPAWWVVRPYGWLVAMGLLTSGYFTLDWIGPMPFPRIFSSAALGPVALLAAIVGSVELGRRSHLGWRSVAVAGANILAALMLLGAAAAVGERIDPASNDATTVDFADTYPVMEDEPFVAAHMFGVPIAAIEVVDQHGEVLSFRQPNVGDIDEIRGTAAASDITVHTMDGQSVVFESVESFNQAVELWP